MRPRATSGWSKRPSGERVRRDSWRCITFREWAMVERSSTTWWTSRSTRSKRGSTITRAEERSVLLLPTFSAFIRVTSQIGCKRSTPTLGGIADETLNTDCDFHCDSYWHQSNHLVDSRRWFTGRGARTEAFSRGPANDHQARRAPAGTLR